MTFPLAEKVAISHYISHDKAHQGQSDGRLFCFGRPPVVAQYQHPWHLLTNWPNLHSFDGILHRITNHTLNSLVSIHRNKWCHQIYPHNSLLSTTPRSNFSVQCSDACARSSVMMDEVTSILVSTLNPKSKHMVRQMFQQWALFDSPCRCPLILDLHERILIYMFQSFHSFASSKVGTCSENRTLRQALFYISATLTQKLHLNLIKSLQLDKMDKNVSNICRLLPSLA